MLGESNEDQSGGGVGKNVIMSPFFNNSSQ